jgi:hypothetical protein
MIASQFTSLWNRHAAALNNYKKFLWDTGKSLKWPFPVETVREYVKWAIKSKGLGADTIKVYLSNFKMAHRLRDLQFDFHNDFFVNSMLKGAKNLSLYRNIFKPARFVMSFQLLKILGHEIASSTWQKQTKALYWAACCVAFFGSFRLGEILPAGFSPFCVETLTWDTITFTNRRSAIVNIRFPNTVRKPQGDFVDIFEIPGKSCCPYSALKKLFKLSQQRVVKNSPVFSFPDGKPLSPKIFTDTIKDLLSKHIGEGAQNITGHSFRAAIPAALANCPSLASDHEIMIWGRWSSEAYKSYTRLKHEAKLSIFKKIVNMYNL